jgi:hypothetical protein
MFRLRLQESNPVCGVLVVAHNAIILTEISLSLVCPVLIPAPGGNSVLGIHLWSLNSAASVLSSCGASAQSQSLRFRPFAGGHVLWDSFA